MDKPPTPPRKASRSDAAPSPDSTHSEADARGVSGKISAFLDSIKPYRELIAILMTLVVSVSGAVAWVVAHFATQTQVHYLECRVSHNILTQMLSVHDNDFAGKIEWRSIQIKELAQHGGGTPQSVATIADLTDQMTALTKEQKNAAAKFQNEIDDISRKCITESPQMEKGPS